MYNSQPLLYAFLCHPSLFHLLPLGFQYLPQEIGFLNIQTAHSNIVSHMYNYCCDIISWDCIPIYNMCRMCFPCISFNTFVLGCVRVWSWYKCVVQPIVSPQKDAPKKKMKKKTSSKKIVCLKSLEGLAWPTTTATRKFRNFFFVYIFFSS